MPSLQSKIAIITGGASGIGLSTAQAFLSAGVEGLTLVDLSKDALERAVATFSPVDQSKVLTVAADVSKEDQVKNFVKETVDRFGRLDVAVLNAGVHQPAANVVDLDEETFDFVMKVNVKGPFLGLKHAGRAMMASPSGGKNCSIILTGSQLGLDGQPTISSYAASKFAVRGLTLSAAAEMGKCGIRVNTICPGPIETPMYFTSTPIAERPTYAGRTVLGRVGQPQEIAAGMLFLASDASSYVSGSSLKVDGGFSRFA